MMLQISKQLALFCESETGFLCIFCGLFGKGLLEQAFALAALGGNFVWLLRAVYCATPSMARRQSSMPTPVIRTAADMASMSHQNFFAALRLVCTAMGERASLSQVGGPFKAARY